MKSHIFYFAEGVKRFAREKDKDHPGFLKSFQAAVKELREQGINHDKEIDYFKYVPSYCTGTYTIGLEF